jgi:hypothetical protein
MPDHGAEKKAIVAMLADADRECHPTWRRCPSTVHPMRSPEPLIVTWQGRQVRVRHDDPHLGTYPPRGAVIRSAVELASDVDGLRRRPAGARGAYRP